MQKRGFNKKALKLLGVLIVILSIVVIIGLFNQHPEKKKPKDPLTFRATYHFTSPDKWKNDPQKPIYFDGKYHYYYLYNGDYPNGNGTEWRHATSKDLVHWKDEGVAIPKYTNKNGDPWSGSVVVDKKNTAGFGKGAIVAIVTQPSANGGKEEQYLWYSTDKGQTFKSYSDQPIMPNPGTEDFRDPKIIWDPQAGKWVMTMAEGTKIGIYESNNLKEWHYTGGFQTQNIGIVECPDLFRMRASDGTYKWVLGASANGKSTGKPNTYAYWIGTYNGKEFIADNNEPQWLDYGYDWYGGVTFENGKSSDKFDKRYALAWMNNWDYPHNTPTLQDGFNGMDSIVRQIELKHEGNNAYNLTSQPMEALNKLTHSTDYFKQIKVNGSKTLKVTGDAYQLEADISWSDLKNVGLRLRESKDKNRHVDVGISTEGQYSYVNRAFTGHPDKSQKYVESKAPFDTSKKKVHLKILVDKTSVEVFVNDGKVAHSNEVFPNLNDKGITLFSEGGTSIFKNVKIKHYDSINKKQLER
ncbi:glycoside hydrolase family 32 protein [Metabacillus arenae]|uniref:Glycoside hydrolase family 32 protein n=1 Tax=Metabacillus arenae TaxID=2771434 RepID=A0A926RZS6_9BACI|nr:glycoside hydrolase family 32 protein [Metabacillus arenae]MBD1383135.1 glycoside hydrolase family 32 protein [Metabacillus arenae]